MIEPNHGSILSIFLRLKASDDTMSDGVLALRAIRISNDFYRSDTLSSFELEKVFPKHLLENQPPIHVNEALPSAHDEVFSKGKLTLIHRSNRYKNGEFIIGHMVQVYIKAGLKHGKWISPRKVL